MTDVDIDMINMRMRKLKEYEGNRKAEHAVIVAEQLITVLDFRYSKSSVLTSVILRLPSSSSLHLV